MDKIVVMRCTSTGWEKMPGEFALPSTPPPTPAPPPPTIPRVMGWAVGDCHTYSKDGKSVFNRQLWAAGFRWNANRKVSYPQRYRNGRIQKFAIRHYATHDDARRIS